MKYILILVCFLTTTVNFGQELNAQKKEFSVTGNAVIRIQPDQVLLRLGVETRGVDLIAIKSKNSKIISEAIGYCKSKEIPEKNIQTDFIRIHPHYDYRADEKLNYFSIDQSLAITIERIEDYEEILTELLKMGINKVDNIQFRTTKLKENREAARKLAVKAAKEKAQFLATEVGVELGKIINISEWSSNPYASYGGFNAANISQNVVQNLNADSDVEGISVGMIPINANITLTYIIK